LSSILFQIDSVDDPSMSVRHGNFTSRHNRGDTKALVVTGDDLTEFTDKHWALALQYTEMVFARTSPKQKLEIVNAHQALGTKDKILEKNSFKTFKKLI